MKMVSPILGWIIGFAVGMAVFLTVGVWVLFAVSYGFMHSNGSTWMMVYFFGSGSPSLPRACGSPIA